MITIYQFDHSGAHALAGYDFYADVVLWAKPAVACSSWEHGFYNEVATVDTDILDNAFTKTNSPGVWGNNEGVTMVRRSGRGCRNTTVGDIMVQDGKHFLVTPLGFTLLSFK